MEDNKVLKEIEDAILEEQAEELKAGAKEVKEVVNYPTYLSTNTVTMPLAEYLGYYDSANKLEELLDAIMSATELHYNKECLRLDGYECDKVLEIVKELRPLEYVERYETLLEAKED